MSKRAFCQQCNKALSACICHSIRALSNQHFLHVLQDPSEKNKAIGTARILALSLSQVKISVGEVFSSHEFDLNNSFLVFPDNSAKAVEHLKKTQEINDNSQFILLDGSWKKAYKLLMMNPFLQHLPKVTFNTTYQTSYRIRKSSREDGVSTVEAGYYLLSELENDYEKFKPLLKSFETMINFQINHIPKAVYQKNYISNKAVSTKEKS